jgi:HEAT repeat protein
VKANDDRIWDRLLDMAKDEDAKVRADVFHTLCDGSPRSRQAEIVAALERMQQDPDLKLRRRVRKLLGHYRATGEINIL